MKMHDIKEPMDEVYRGISSDNFIPKIKQTPVLVVIANNDPMVSTSGEN
jgi:predicted alpha/beta-fold hydrolase